MRINSNKPTGRKCCNTPHSRPTTVERSFGALRSAHLVFDRVDAGGDELADGGDVGGATLARRDHRRHLELDDVALLQEVALVRHARDAVAVHLGRRAVVCAVTPTCQSQQQGSYTFDIMEFKAISRKNSIGCFSDKKQKKCRTTAPPGGLVRSVCHHGHMMQYLHASTLILHSRYLCVLTRYLRVSTLRGCRNYTYKSTNDIKKFKANLGNSSSFNTLNSEN